MITIYTDGACSGNPGVGGWGAVILEVNKEEIYLNGGNDNTTNNRM
jgi:ribonuclease HI